MIIGEDLRGNYGARQERNFPGPVGAATLLFGQSDLPTAVGPDPLTWVGPTQVFPSCAGVPSPVAAAGPAEAGRLTRMTVAAMTEASKVSPAATAMARL